MARFEIVRLRMAAWYCATNLIDGGGFGFAPQMADNGGFGKGAFLL